MLIRSHLAIFKERSKPERLNIITSKILKGLNALSSEKSGNRNIIITEKADAARRIALNLMKEEYQT